MLFCLSESTKALLFMILIEYKYWRFCWDIYLFICSCYHEITRNLELRRIYDLLQLNYFYKLNALNNRDERASLFRCPSRREIRKESPTRKIAGRYIFVVFIKMAWLTRCFIDYYRNCQMCRWDLSQTARPGSDRIFYLSAHLYWTITDY